MTFETKKFKLTMDAANVFQDFSYQLEDEIGKKKRVRNASKTKVMEIDHIDLQPPCWDNSPSVQDDKDFQITTQAETAIVNVSDKDVVFKWGQELLAVGAAAAWGVEERVIRKEIKRFYIKKEIHFGVDATEVADTIWHFELAFKYTYVSDWQLARMIGRLA